MIDFPLGYGHKNLVADGLPIGPAFNERLAEKDALVLSMRNSERVSGWIGIESHWESNYVQRLWTNRESVKGYGHSSQRSYEAMRPPVHCVSLKLDMLVVQEIPSAELQSLSMSLREEVPGWAGPVPLSHFPFGKIPFRSNS